jgi:FMN phosphatase YigB (HAD superfamily)
MTRIVTLAKKKGARLVLLSNTCRPHFEFVKRAHPDLLAPFDAFALSYEVGAIKPEEAIFRRAVQFAQVAPSRCFYTDDIESYITAAGDLGIDAEPFVDPRTLVTNLAHRGLDLSAALEEK